MSANGGGGGGSNAERCVVEDATNMGLEIMNGSDGYPCIVKMYRNKVMIQDGDGRTVNSVLSIDNYDLHKKSIHDLVLILRGGSGLSRLRVRGQHSGAAVSVINVSKPVKVFAAPRSSSSIDPGYRQVNKARVQPPSSSVRQFPTKAVMQWNYQAARDDELTAAAGEVIVVGGEYKNPGWVWASRVGPNGEAIGAFKLCRFARM